MTSKELANKILKEKHTLTDKEWLTLYDEALKLNDFKEFKETLAGNILGQMCSFARHRED